MEESLKSARFVHRLIILTATALIVFALSLDKPTSQYVDALAEFNLLQPALKKMSDLHIQQDSEYYTTQGVKKIITDEFSSVDLSELRFVGAQDDRFGQPRFGAGTKAPLESLYRYLLLTEDWEKLRVWKVDIESFRMAIQKFRENHKDIIKVKEIYITAERPESWDGDLYHEFNLSVAITIVGESNKKDIISLSNEDNVVLHNGFEVLTPKIAIDFLKNSKLIVEVDGEKEALPALRQVWDSVKESDVGAITAVLKRKAREERRQSERKVTLVGISLPSTLMTLFGPLVLISLMLYLLALVSHFEVEKKFTIFLLFNEIKLLQKKADFEQFLTY